jgi:hypothetical protein
VPRTLEIAELRISGKTAEKILRIHGIHADEVRETVEGVGRLPYWWVEDERQGRRAMLITSIRDEAVIVVLYPCAGELGTVWNLGSAYFANE